MKKTVSVLCAAVLTACLISFEVVAAYNSETCVLTVDAPVSYEKLREADKIEKLVLNGVLNESDFAEFLKWNGSEIKSLDLSACVIEGGVLFDYALAKMQGLEEVILPESLEVIGEGAFMHCQSLKSVTIPSGVKTIEWGAFYGCERLSEVKLNSAVKFSYYNNAGPRAFGRCALDLSNFSKDFPLLDREDMINFCEQAPLPVIRLDNSEMTITAGDEFKAPYSLRTSGGGYYSELIEASPFWLKSKLSVPEVVRKVYKGGRLLENSESFTDTVGDYIVRYEIDNDFKELTLHVVTKNSEGTKVSGGKDDAPSNGNSTQNTAEIRGLAVPTAALPINPGTGAEI